MVNITELQSPPVNVRLLRYQMQSVARFMLPNNRVKICLRYQREKYGTVDILKHRQTQKAFYSGLMICGNVWICPVCAAKISERRRKELRKGFDTHLLNGGSCTMLTLTFSHSLTDKLSDLLALLAKALVRFKGGKRFNKLRKELGIIGNIRALEVTYGSNGFHPHIHLLIMHTISIDPWDRMEYQERFYDLWDIACSSVGLSTSFEHGLKLDDAQEADEYIGKWGDIVKETWGIDSEMTKFNTKKGRVGSLTPFDFLRAVVEDGDLQYTNQYAEYALAMRGKTQLKWSPGLKEMFEIDHKTDEEIAESNEDPNDKLAGIGWQDWKYILQHEYRSKLLDLVEQVGVDEAFKVIGIKKESAAINSESQLHEA